MLNINYVLKLSYRNWSARKKIAANGQGLAKAGEILLCPPGTLPNKVVMINLVEKVC